MIIFGTALLLSDLDGRASWAFNAGRNLIVGIPKVLRMTQVAQEESGYQQFTDPKNPPYGVPSFWPNTSKAHLGLTHVGLMQVPTTMSDAWSWGQDSQDGVVIPSQNSMQCKLGMANRIAGKIEAKHPGLSLTPCQLEEWGLDFLGPSPGEYYIPKCVGGSGTSCTGGSWQWSINQHGNLCGVCDIIAVRNNIPPTGGSATMCQPPTGISADPPTTLNSSCCSNCLKKVNMTDLNCHG